MVKRILLYEPGVDGHRPVILRYLINGLPAHGWQPVVFRDSRYAQLKDSDLCEIECEAFRQGCVLIHLLTIDGCGRNWLRPRKRRRGTRIQIVGTYYLFNNLWGWRGLAWKLASIFGYIDLFLISDPFINVRWFVPGLKKKIGTIPDPWCSSEFPAIGKITARKMLGLPIEKNIILVFGEISQRKGIGRILTALRLVRGGRTVIVFAGHVADDARIDIESAMSDVALTNRICIHDRHIPEDMVSSYFYAADAVLSDYPKWFKVSSGAFTRALAAGSVPIVPNHGVNAELCKRHNFGYTYPSEDVLGLSKVINMQQDSLESKSSDLRLAQAREMVCFLESTVAHYNKLCDTA